MMKRNEPFILSTLQGVVISSEFPCSDPADSLEQQVSIRAPLLTWENHEHLSPRLSK